MQPPAEPAADGPPAAASDLPSGGGVRLLICLSLAFLFHASWELARGTLVVSVRTLVYWPLLVGTTASLLIGAASSARRGRWRPGIAALLFLLAGVALLANGWLGRVMVFAPRENALPEPGTDMGYGTTVVEYSSEPGSRLRGAVVRGTGPEPRPAGVFFHGNGVSAASCVETARLFASRNIDLVLAEYRGYGGCPGTLSEEGMIRDARAAIELAEECFGRPAGEMIIIGRSLGSGVAARVAGEGASRALILISPFTSVTDLTTQLVPAPLAWLGMPARFDSEAALRDAQQPVLIIHGTDDQIVPFGFGRRLAEQLGARAQLLALEGLGHNDIFREAPYRIADAVGAFAAEHAAPAPGPR